MTTGPEARRLGLVRALEDFEQLLAPWLVDELPVDIDDLDDLPVYTKDQP